MNRSKTYRWLRRAVWGTLLVVATIGCNPLTTIAFLTHRDTPQPAECPLKYKEGPKKDKEEIVVVVLTSMGNGQSYEFAGADRILASEIAKKIPDLAKANKQKQKIVVVSPTQVDKFKMSNPNWKLMHPTAIGKKLEADFVLDIHLDAMRLYQPGSLNNIYEGFAEVSVDMYDVDAEGKEPKDKYVYPFSFPKTGVRDAGSIPLRTFKQLFLERLAVELTFKHIDHKPSEDIDLGR